MYLNLFLRLKKSTFIRIYLLLILASFSACKERVSDYEEDENAESNFSMDGYSDGTYCAEITYYYSATRTESTYTLEVEIENNDLTLIHWPNGGWLDNSHFTPPDISDGSASFTSDAGIDYTVTIIGKQVDCSTSSYAESEDDILQQQEDEEDRIQEEEDYEEKRRREEEEERQLEKERKSREEDQKRAEEESQDE